MITPVILSGGGGTRLWPLSRTLYPKQYLSLLNTNRSLLQETVLRGFVSDLFEAPVLICHNEHRFLVAEQLREIQVQASAIILENEPQNTAGAIATACLLQEKVDNLLLILPADHSIQAPDQFYQAIKKAKAAAEQGSIVTFGMKSHQPDTRYGYIESAEAIPHHAELLQVSRFVEKPNLEMAKTFVESGRYYWNSGIFLFKPSTMLKELERLEPALLDSCRVALASAKQDLDFLRLGPLPHPASNLSIDYAVMEHTPLAAVIPVDMGWSDIGSWDALWHITDKDPQGNVLIGDIISHDVHDSYIRSDRQLVSVLGLDHVIVVATEDAILVTDQDHMHHMPDLIKVLKKDHRSELYTHKRVYRPWGFYHSIDKGDRFQVKRIMVKPGAKTSTQIHYHRAEHWVVVEGTAKVTRGEEALLLHENESVYLPMGIKHAVENPGKIPLHLIEVQSGAYLGEDDIVRIEDKYGRAKPDA